MPQVIRIAVQIPILFQDGDIVVIDKPTGLPARSGQADDPCPADAQGLVQAQLGLDYLAAQQRPDPEMSGVLVLATGRETGATLTRTLAARATEKVYLALVHGKPARQAGTVDAPLAREHGEVERYRVTTPRDKAGQAAHTRYRVLETAPGDRYSLLEAIPEPGGSAQVRVHLAYLGVPVVGDLLYSAGEAGRQAPDARRAAKEGRKPAGPPARGGARASAARAPAPGASAVFSAPGPAGGQVPRLCLHAYRLSFAHPRTGQTVTVSAQPPALFGRLASGLPELSLAAAGRHIRKTKPGAAGLDGLIDLALARRAPLAGHDAANGTPPDGPQTTIYRLIHAAADGLPGLTVDRYGEALVVSIYDEGGRPEPPPPALIEKLVEATGATAAYVKYRQRQAGQVDEEALPALAPALPIAGRPLGEYPAYEAGLAYLVRPAEGWNPGLFADMREMRARVRGLGRGEARAQLFCLHLRVWRGGHGGWGRTRGQPGRIVAGAGAGRANYRANGFEPDPDGFLYGDTFDWLPRLAGRDERFDVVILDPPGFARTKTHLFSAARDYGKLAQAAAPVHGGRRPAGGLLQRGRAVVDQLPQPGGGRAG